jgi:hypothetical protein
VEQVFYRRVPQTGKGMKMTADYADYVPDYDRDHKVAYEELKRLMVNATPREVLIARAAREEGICARAVYEFRKREREEHMKAGRLTPFVFSHPATIPLRTEEERKKYDPRHRDAVD